jgi:Gram-negative bacterial TonB protein C-terminal
MKMIMLFFSIFFFTGILSAQEVRKDTSNCSCYREIYVSYPDMPDSQKVEGTVIVEYELDTFCMAANPKIVQSLGVAYDKEALRVIKLMIAFNNSCKSRCRFSVCNKRKVKLPLTFRLPDEED